MSRKLFLSLFLALCSTILPEFAHGQTFLGKNLAEWTTELEKGNTAARRGAAFALGKLGAPSAVSVLKKALHNDSDEWVREACACALGEISSRNLKTASDAGLLSFLAETMHCDKKGVTTENPGGSPHVRRAAAYAVGCMGVGARPALPQLREAALTDKSPVVRQNAAWRWANSARRRSMP